jgi:hypothetical protein
MLVTQRKCAENTFFTEESNSPVKQQKSGLFYQNSWIFTCYCTQLILGNVSILKSRLLPVAGSFTVTA